jgi:hypothetical protein
MSATIPFFLTARNTPLRIMSTSDWHLGNARVPAVNICNRLREVIFPLLPNIDLLNIGGDVWDTLLSINNESNEIISFIIDLLRICNDHRIVVRVLLGTFTHDRDQSTVFEIYHNKCQFTNDLRYIDKVYLEEISALDVRILYLPDDLPYESSDACLAAVAEMMLVRGWTWVDYVFGHGYFEHMLPPHIPKPPKCTFRVAQFTSFVRRYICMGHIHLSDITGQVIYNNSFDRIAHGEEAPKGCMIIEDLGTSAKLRFIENKRATKFITLDLSKYPDNETIGKHYLDLLKEKFNGASGYVRVSHPSAEVRQTLHRLTTSQHQELFYSFRKSLDESVSDGRMLARKSFNVNEYPTPTITTLPQMIFKFLENNGGAKLTPSRISEILSNLSSNSTGS